MVEHWSPKPSVVGSNPATPVFLIFIIYNICMFLRYFKILFLSMLKNAKEISWPKKRDVFSMMIVIFVVVVVVSIVFFCFDNLFLYLLKLFVGS